MEIFKFFSICFVLVSLKPRSEAYEVRKEYLFNNWWNRVLIKIFANKQDDREDISPCSRSFYPPVKDMIILNQMLESEFRLKPKVYKKWVPLHLVSRNLKTGAVNPNSFPLKLTEPATTALTKTSTTTTSNSAEMKPVNIVELLPDRTVCFGVHQLEQKYPRITAERQKFDNIVNSFITYVNHKNDYPHKIRKIESIKQPGM